MREAVLFTIVLGGLMAFTSCAKDECECNIGGATTIVTEDDVANGALKTYCSELDQDLVPPDECHIK